MKAAFLASISIAVILGALGARAQAGSESPCLLGETFEETLRKFPIRELQTLTSDQGQIETFNRAFIGQILSATGKETYTEACDSTDTGILYTHVFKHPELPAESYRVVYFHRGSGRDQGSIFAGDASTPYARIVDGRIVDCKVR